MAVKKQHIIPPKKSDKKKLEASNSKTKSTYSKQTFRIKRNEFGDDDSL